ncbi:MAG TPA: dihydrofolate reductase family protein, partial [Paenarthrobacter sp.]|nr:dihydrofolate reductase family protein [Paenarthrobacter sp.]
RTYDIFAGYWPNQSADDPIAGKFNNMPKFVVSRSVTDPSWQGTTVLPDVSEVASIKDRFEDIHVVGSGDLTRSLLNADLVDRLNLYVYPLTFGKGKKLWTEGTGIPAAFRLVGPPQAFPKGALCLVYERAGDPVTGIDIGAQ